MEKLPVFLCYRQDDGVKMAEWLYERLNDQPISTDDADSPRLDVYFDQTAPGISNWKKLHIPALQRAKAMLVVCTPLLPERREPFDYVHEELELWVRKRKTAPIPIVKSSDDELYLPDYVRSRWRDCQRLPFDLEEWKTRECKEQSDAADAFLKRIREGIRLSQTGIVFEDLRRFKRLSWGLAASLVLALIFLGGAGYQWNRATNARDAESAAKNEAIGAREKESAQRHIAEGAQKQAEDNLELAQKREKEATEARDAERKRAAELEDVTGFQASMIGRNDTETMGLKAKALLRELVVDGLESRNVPEDERAEHLDAFAAAVRYANGTTFASRMLGDNILEPAAQAIDKDFADQPLVRAALQQTVANTYRHIGLYEPAMPLQEAALETRRQELDDDHPDTLSSINNMGILLQAMGKLSEAEPYYRDALAGHRRVLGDNHPDTLNLIGNMGSLLQAFGKFEDALVHRSESLEGSRRVRGDDHPDTLTSINNMGFLLKEMGEYEQAEPYWREGLEGSRRVLGENHPDTLKSIGNMGDLLQTMGKYAEALPYKREALEAHRRVLGDDHPDTLTSINNMGGLLEQMGEYDQALRYAREALVGYRRVLGDDHPLTLTSLNNLASLLESMGKYDDALPYYSEALEGFRRALGDDHPNTLMSINNMGFLLSRVGRSEDALAYFRDALEGLRRVLSDDHPDTLIAIHNMGRLVRDLGGLDEAEALGAEAVRGARAMLAPSHPFRLAALTQHGLTLAAMQRFTEAEAELLEAYQGKVESIGEKHKRTLGAVKSLADLYDAWHEAEPDAGYDAKAAEWWAKLPATERAASLIKLGMRLLEDGRHAEAEAALRDCLDIRQEALAEGHWLIFNTMSVLGECLAAQGADPSLARGARIEKLREAEPQLLDGYEGMQDHPEAPDERERQALERIVKLYETWHAAEPGDKGDHGRAAHATKAAEWRAKLAEWRASTQPATQPNSSPPEPSTSPAGENEP